MLDVADVLVVIDLTLAAVGAQDTVFPVVLSACTLVTRDKYGLTRYTSYDVQIRHDRCGWYDR